MLPGGISRIDAITYSLIVIFSTAILYLAITGIKYQKDENSSPSLIIEKAEALEGKGDIPASLRLYRKAISLNPALCDPMSSQFLGKGFEERLNLWIKELKNGDMENRTGALENAAFIFRKLNGGCG